ERPLQDRARGLCRRSGGHDTDRHLRALRQGRLLLERRGPARELRQYRPEQRQRVQRLEQRRSSDVRRRRRRHVLRAPQHQGRVRVLRHRRCRQLLCAVADRSVAVLTRILVIIACLLLRPALAAEPASEDVDAQAAPDSAAVIVDGVELFRVAGSASFPAAERAARVTARIVAAADDSRIPVNAIKTEQRDSRIDIVAGNRHLVGVVDADAAIEGIAVPEAALLHAMHIRDAIARYRAERTTERLVQSAMVASAATAMAALALWLIWTGFRRARLKLDQRYRTRVHSLSIQSFEVVRAESIWRALDGTLSVLRWLVVAALVYALSTFALGQFPWTRATAERLLDLVVQPVLSMASGVLSYIPKLIFLVLLFLGVRYLLKLLSLFFAAVGAGRVPLRGFDAEWAQPTYHIARILIILLTLVIAYPYLPGSGSAAFQGLSIFAGLMLSLGASSAMASLIAGYTVTYRRAFRVGDRITVGDL